MNTTARVINGLLLVASMTACAGSVDIQFAGHVKDTPEWQDPAAANHPAGKSSGLVLSGWSFFGGAAPCADAADADTQAEKLPPFVSAVSPVEGAQEDRAPSYAAIQSPGRPADRWIPGRVAVHTDTACDLIRIQLGETVPDIWRVGVLIDHLDSPETTPAELRLISGSMESSPIMTTGGAGTANSQPDWYFWDICAAEAGSEIIIRVAPNSGIAALGGLLFLSGNKSRHIGEFSREGEYIKDYYVYKDGETYHLFYNVGDAGMTQDWQEPMNEKAFGHATSKDLVNWEQHPRVLPVIPGTWEGQVVSAPSILKHEGLYYMTYTGFDDRVLGKQTIGLATSEDLFHWERYAGNPIYEAPDSWTQRNQSGWIDCRDAHIIKYKDEFLMFTMVTTKEGKGAIALASSPDLKQWTDLGPALVTFTTPESPRVFEHEGTFYMFVTSGYGKKLVKTSDPKSSNWQEVPFRWPTPGLWSGWEVVQDGDQTIFSAFFWKFNGNFIRFWNVDWQGEVPVVNY